MAPEERPTAKTLEGSALYSLRVYWICAKIFVSLAKIRSELGLV